MAKTTKTKTTKAKTTKAKATKTKATKTKAIWSKSKVPVLAAPKQGERRPYITLSGKDPTELDYIDHDKSYARAFQLMVEQARSSTPSAVVRAVPCNFDKSRSRRDYSLVHKVDLVDIYHYYERHPTLAGTVSTRNFGRMVGLPISKSSIDRWINSYEELKEAALNSPEGTMIRVHRKNTIIDKTLLLWLEDQRKKNLPVHGGQIKEAAEMVYTILLEAEDDHIRPHDRPLFSAAWVTGFVSRNEVVRLDLIGESGSVDLDGIQEELEDIRSICSRFHPDNIYNCDEAGMYLLELGRTTFTTQGYLQGFKPNKECRVTFLFCVNATGSSIWKAETMSSLRPLVLGEFTL